MSLEINASAKNMDVPESLQFATQAERDAYFSANPNRLKTDTYVTTAGELQRYNGAAFESTAVTIKGDKGDNAPQMLTQFSIDGKTNWSNTLDKEQHYYWRWSTDGGVTWSPDGVRYSAEGSGLTPQQATDLDDNTTARHAHSNQALLNSTTGTFTTARETKLDNLQERFLGVFVDSAARDIAYPTPSNGQYCKQEDTNSFWFYGAGAWVDTGSTSTGDMLASLYDPQQIASDSFDRANHTGEQVISTVTGLETKLAPLGGGVADSGVTPVDTDKIIINDNGIMRQTSFSKVWSWITGKMSGAVSSIITSNLTQNRVLVSNGSGKVSVSDAPSSVLNATKRSQLMKYPVDTGPNWAFMSVNVGGHIIDLILRNNGLLFSNNTTNNYYMTITEHKRAALGGTPVAADTTMARSTFSPTDEKNVLTFSASSNTKARVILSAYGGLEIDPLFFDLDIFRHDSNEVLIHCEFKQVSSTA